KKLDRYDNSLIIIQGDHGAKFEVTNGGLKTVKSGEFSDEWSTARSRALLLIKTPGKTSEEKLMRSEADTMLIDIAPTIAESLGLELQHRPEGASLVGNDVILGDRTRYYHFFNKEGKNEHTSELKRYIIKDAKAEYDRTISINQGQ